MLLKKKKLINWYSIINLSTYFVQISQNFMLVSIICSHLNQSYTLYLTVLNSFSCMQQILVSSLLIFIRNIF